MLREFRGLAGSTTIVELALAIVLAQAISNVAYELLADLILPPVGLLFGHRSLPSLFINLTPEKTTPSGGPVDSIEKAHYAGASVIAYGSFIDSLLHLFVLLLVTRLVLKWITRLRSADAVARGDWPPPPTDDDVTKA